MSADLMDRCQILENGWGLGQCFTSDSAPTLASSIDSSQQIENAIYIAVTHDCSVVNQRLAVEPVLEYFVALPVDTPPNGMLSHARNIRKLHVPILVNDIEQFFELSMGLRGFVSRQSLEICKTDDNYQLSIESKATLIRWIANRYTTQTFPDEFNRRIQPLIDGKKPPLKRLLESPVGEVCASIYLRLTPDSIDQELADSYALEVLLLFRDEDAKKIGYPAMDDFGNEIADCIQAVEGITPVNVTALSEKAASYHDVVKMQRWQLDYISLREPGRAAILRVEQS
ncbi:MAG: hypothetical protein L3J22_03825 [Xanthomonadales bacterium]|nr:hypothetical protein [Xanthomonadales bacterium]